MDVDEVIDIEETKEEEKGDHLENLTDNWLYSLLNQQKESSQLTIGLANNFDS